MKACIKPDRDTLLQTEWLLTNGLGGFGGSTISGIPTRKFHGLLVASLPSPFGRRMMLNFVEERLIIDNKEEVRLTDLFLKHEKQLNNNSI